MLSWFAIELIEAQRQPTTPASRLVCWSATSLPVAHPRQMMPALPSDYCLALVAMCAAAARRCLQAAPRGITHAGANAALHPDVHIMTVTPTIDNLSTILEDGSPNQAHA